MRNRLLWLTLLGSAFGYIEGAVVVYLREPYYPAGFAFPLADIPTRLIRTEVVREITTVLLLLSVAMLTVRQRLHRFAVFAWCFAVWDLVYYLTLKVLIDWPASLLTWDILYLIPLPWTAPVLAPMLVSACLLGAALLLLRLPPDRLPRPRAMDWIIEVAAGVVIIATFLWNVPVLQARGVPHYYPWWLFLSALAGGSGWFIYRVGQHLKARPTASK